MAHAMCRVSLSTARPSDAQFAFVSHNPGNSDAQLYCHLFRARHARAVSINMTKPSKGCVINHFGYIASYCDCNIAHVGSRIKDVVFKSQ